MWIADGRQIFLGFGIWSSPSEHHDRGFDPYSRNECIIAFLDASAEVIFNDLFSSAKKTLHFTITQISLLILFKEIILL
jgi:hypothetical protein